MNMYQPGSAPTTSPLTPQRSAHRLSQDDPLELDLLELVGAALDRLKRRKWLSSNVELAVEVAFRLLCRGRLARRRGPTLQVTSSSSK